VADPNAAQPGSTHASKIMQAPINDAGQLVEPSLARAETTHGTSTVSSEEVWAIDDLRLLGQQRLRGLAQRDQMRALAFVSVAPNEPISAAHLDACYPRRLITTRGGKHHELYVVTEYARAVAGFPHAVKLVVGQGAAAHPVFRPGAR